ncbi:Oligoendopeptidase F [Alkalibacterium sp. AK22]|uniref:M3 family oligoendopeptidase n=1 Tax=Alkalibacterium sp. AK22 TaxID=1229520 RepID=UPI000450D0F5|nr:M3 family oligoendopeptidase [Alkalibacterium sp. AK22]EXJ22782.1 Oligoendopeptidase F [Alkalibacterium sp. AK22]
MPKKLTWDMNTVFEGGSSSTALHTFIEETRTVIGKAEALIKDWGSESGASEAGNLVDFLLCREEAFDRLTEASTFARGLLSADVNDSQAAKRVNQLSQLGSQLSDVETRFMKKIKAIPDDAWEALLSDEKLQVSRFNLNEKRKKGQKLLSESEERIIQQLSLDGLEGFSNVYQSLVNSIRVPVEMNGARKFLSAGQAANKLIGHPDPTVRSQILSDWEHAWKEKAPMFADTLNHLAGFRLKTYQLRGENDFLRPALEYNRMEQQTLDTMWETITKNKPKLVEFLDRKAALMGKDKLGWADVTAPLSLGTFEPKTYSFEEAQTFVTTHFGSFSTEMQALAEIAFEHSWVEAEDREGKRPGAYCSNLPVSRQSRIFMTFGGSASNVSTLAHELGHAYHSHVMRDLPHLNRRYAMNVAETASTFCEMIISDATVAAANATEEKIALLDSKISRAAVMFMNIHSRYLFETRFYAQRQSGLLDEKELSQLMEEAQKEAFDNALESYHPMFWASKLHFHITGVPFYNFPYTFGFLFSLGIYSYAKHKGTDFEEDYRKLLRDTASMTTEELAYKHLNADLTQPGFWQSAIDEVLTDIETYFDLTAPYIK